MLSKKNKDMLTQRSAEKRQTFSLKKLSVGIVSVAVGSFLMLGTQTDVYAEEMNDHTDIETSIEEAVEEKEPEQVIDEEETNNQQVLAAEQVEETIPGETVPHSTIEIEEGEYGARALDHIKELSEGIGQRIAQVQNLNVKPAIILLMNLKNWVMRLPNKNLTLQIVNQIKFYSHVTLSLLNQMPIKNN